MPKTHKVQKPKHKCSFCGCTYETFSFKHGYVCDGCLQYIKSTCSQDDQTNGLRTADDRPDDSPADD